jgi:hypothetical protein
VLTTSAFFRKCAHDAYWALAIVKSLFSFAHTLISGHIAGYSQEVALSAAHLKRTLQICRTRLNQRGMARS